jgi:DNA-directed RNA polymerase specialized sigma24 family protein
MSSDDDMHQRLCRWAQAVTVGDGSGYPSTSVLHASWQPPAVGQLPSIKVAPHSDVGVTHRAIAAMSERLIATVVVHYVLRPPIELQAQMLGCSVPTVYQRAVRVRKILAAGLGD